MIMKKFYFRFFLFIYCLPAFSADLNESCSKWYSWVEPLCQQLHEIWYEGNPELYVTGYAWHNRYTYTKAKLAGYNENAWGGGFGKGIYHSNGDWQGIFAMAFLDSHKYLEPVLGYAFLKTAAINVDARIGIGYTILLTQRPDIWKGIPFAGVLPWVSLNYRYLTLSATYIPGGMGAGNVLFLVGKWTFFSS